MISGLLLTGAAWAQDSVWIDVSTADASVIVRDEQNNALARFEQISIGRGGASRFHRRGDSTTPLGEYRVTAILGSKRYNTFIALSYPNVQQADQALARGMISAAEHRQLLDADAEGTTPPATTALGGNIGLHGLGDGDIRIHQQMNWTRGCVALTNEQIKQLLTWIAPGTRVVVH